MKWFRWFLAGALAVPLGHQVMLWALYHVGHAPYAPYSMTPTKPFGVPQVISLSFWGGVWGLILGAVLLRVISRRAWWATAILFGAIATTLVAAFVVPPLKGKPIKASPSLAVIGLLLNGTWAYVTALFYRLFSRESGARTAR